MSDIRLAINDDLLFDIDIVDGDLESDEGLETAVAISIFSDRRVTDEELSFPQTDKKGWWGDMFPDVDQDQIGSRLWLIGREKVLQETAKRAEDYCKEGLAWLIEDGVAKSVAVAAAYDLNKYLRIAIDIAKPDGNSSKFQVLWDKQSLVRVIGG